LEETLALTSQELVLRCVNAALEKKPKALVILGIKNISSFADYYVIMSGDSEREVQALASIIQEKMKKTGILPLGTEGTAVGKWILLDYIDVVISIFHEPVRVFYDLERLWSDAPIMRVPEDTQSLTALSDEM
jgi:ribosome-associated protein